ncbi:DUF1415 domain-containing protein [Neolewinella agarilytica]|uniref:DUF1415 domain-containing protein n=1 Tax=Neolewinella agarilytica TaxID=478744 RepID=UPI002356BDFE|nr:DUF1415 domain-containing protein [Neolewinella agarilytica]
MSPAETTRQWVADFVIRYALCPFAAKPFQDGNVLFLEVENEDIEDCFMAALAQVQSLLEEQSVETTLLVFSHALSDFDTFLDFVHTFEDTLLEAGANQLVQLAHFHPDYTFDGVAEDDPGNLTNRAPYPTLQLLRVGSVAAAVAAYPDVEGIPERNVHRMRELFG